MNDLFERVKSSIDLVGYIQSETGLQAKKVGSDEFRISPCPFCGHNECFSINARDQYFKCFSTECDRKGDVVTFEYLLRGHKDNRAAAEEIAAKRGITLDTSGDAGRAKKYKNRKASKLEPSRSGIDHPRANVLRGIVADFYHQELLNDQRALEYQTKERGHSLDILKAFKIGYASGKSLVAHIKKKGYALSDLIVVGLAKKWGKAYRPTFPKGAFIYPHWINREVVYFTIKPPSGKNPFQVKKQYAAQDWVCLNQDILTKSTDPVIIAEGENDLLSLIDKARQPNVICTVGNFNTSNILAYLQKNSQGKVFYLCFDRDDAGRGYVQKYAAAILAGGGQVRVIEISEPHKDVDDFLRASKDPQDDFQRLIQDAQVIEKTPSINQDVFQGKDGAGSLVSRFKDFQVLGEMADKRLAFWSRVKHQIYLTSLRDFNLDTLDQIGGEEVRWKVVRRTKELEGDNIHFFALKRDIIIEAGKRLLGEEKWLGQGVNLLDDGRLLIISGDRAVIWDGRKFEWFDEPMIQTKFLKRNPAEKWIDLKLLEKTILRMDKDQAAKIIESVIQLISQWGFLSPVDVNLVAGFLLSQMVQAVFEWRPHCWVSASHGSGKTLLIGLFDRIAGKLSRRYEGQVLTEAGFRQDLKHDFPIITIDEFEKSQRREELINLLRSAGRGGISTKGSASGKAVHYSIRHMVLIASIDRELGGAAEKHRFLYVDLKKDPGRNPKIPTKEEAERLRIQCYAFAIWAALKVTKLINQLGQFPGYEPRYVEAFAVPLSMMCITEPDPLERLERSLLEVLQNRKDYGEGERPEDYEQLLEDILTSTVKVAVVKSDGQTIYDVRSINQLLQDPEFNADTLQAVGVKKCKDGLFLAPQIIGRKLLRDTRWRGRNIRGRLNRFTNARKVQRRLGGERIHGILLMSENEKGYPADWDEIM